MFSIIDRYIIRSFLFSYFVCAVTLLGLTVILDAFLQIKDFMDAARSPGQAGLGVLSVMFQYYSVRLPVFFQTTSPAILLASAMFSMAQFNRNNELVPIRASGISLFRTITPLFLFALLLTGLLIANQEILIPAMAVRIQYTDSVLRGGSDAAFDSLDIQDDLGNEWDIPRYERGEDRIKGTLLINAYYPQNGRVKTQVTAQSAQWKRSRTDGVPRWHLSNGTEDRYVPAEDGVKRLSADEGNYDTRFGQDGYVVLRPGDNPADPFRIVSDFTPVDIVPVDRSILYQPSSVLRMLYASDPTRSDVAVALQSRYAFPLSNIVLLLIGLPFVLGTECKSTFAGLVVCIVICAAFYGVHALCTELGKEQTLSPALAAWLPIAIFAPLGVFLFDGVKT